MWLLCLRVLFGGVPAIRTDGAHVMAYLSTKNQEPICHHTSRKDTKSVSHGLSTSRTPTATGVNNKQAGTLRDGTQGWDSGMGLGAFHDVSSMRGNKTKQK